MLEPAHYSWLLGYCRDALFLHKLDNAIIWLKERINLNIWRGYVKLNLLILNVWLKVFCAFRLRVFFPLLQAVTRVDLVLVSQLLNRHRHTVTGAQMSVETTGGRSERAPWTEKSYLFIIRLFISLLCRCPVVLRVLHGSGGPRKGTEICEQECQSGSGLVSDAFGTGGSIYVERSETFHEMCYLYAASRV